MRIFYATQILPILQYSSPVHCQPLRKSPSSVREQQVERMAISSLELVFIVSSIILYLLPLTVAQNFPHVSCISERGNFTDNSSYQANLDSLLTSFSNTTVGYGFYNSSAGEVNAIGLCRGDLSPDTCRDCIKNSSDEIRQRCPNNKEAIVYYDTCMLRYSNRSIFGIVEVSPYYPLGNTANFSDVTTFNEALQRLLLDLRTKAAAGGSLRKYASGETYGSFNTIYALVQCTPDLEDAECSSCLDRIGSSAADFIVGKQGGNIKSPSCNFRFEIYPFYGPPAETPSPAPAAGKSNTTRTVIIIVIPTVVSVILIICIFIFLRMRKPRRQEINKDEILNVDSLQFNLGTIRAATDDFNDSNKLGQGGFGAVYKGTLLNGQDIAVKRLSKGSGQGELEFKTEVLLVAKLQHRNLVRLLGFCLEGTEKLLIYEFVPNASLDQFIFDPDKRSQLHWERRFKIIGGISRGLLYLHEDSRLRIIHRDLKASNVLLDEEMNPKISDFGMARLFSMDQTQDATSRIVGTYGYMAPEYAMHGNFSVKSDVYSFGVLILEIVAGQRNSCFRNGENVEDLISFAWRSWRDGSAINMVDPSVRSGSRSEIMRCIHIGLLCVQENIADRPTMASVVLMLSSFSLTLPVPSDPAFFLHSKSMEQEAPLLHDPISGVTESSDNVSAHISINEASVTELYPR